MPEIERMKISCKDCGREASFPSKEEAEKEGWLYTDLTLSGHPHWYCPLCIAVK